MLREGYIKSQLDWHFKQKKQILPPNYSNESFYKDIGVLEEPQSVKNPVVEVIRKMRKKSLKDKNSWDLIDGEDWEHF